MTKFDRRSVIAGSAVLVTGGALTSAGSAGANDASDEGLEVSVRISDSTTIDNWSAPVHVSVTNHGDDPVSVPVTLEIAHINEELETLELDSGESDSASEILVPMGLGPGDHEWTVTVGDETETGTMTVEADDDYEDRDEGFYLEVHVDEEVTLYLDESRDEASPGFDMTVLNYAYEPVSATVFFEIDDEVQEYPFEFEPRDYEHVPAGADLGVGEYEWTATVGDETETGRMTILREEAEEESEEEGTDC